VHEQGELARVARSACRGDVVARYQQVRAGNGPLGDGVAQVHVDIGPGRSHVAAGGKAGANVMRALRAPQSAACDDVVLSKASSQWTYSLSVCGGR
jgi:hypothetical protein